MTVTAPGRQPGATAPSGDRRRGWIDTRDLPMAGPTDLPTQLQPRVEPRPPRTPPPPTEPFPRVTPAMATPAGPITTVTIVLTSNLLDPAQWARAVDNVRRTLDMAMSHRIETFSCGSDPVRYAIWYAELRPRYVGGVREDLERLAGVLHGGARIAWAPCSPIDLR